MALVEEVDEHMKEATWLLQGMGRGLKLAAVKKEKELKEAETQRLCHIKIADRSEHGWAMAAK